MKPFREIAFESFEPRTILIDIDGTLMSDGESVVSSEVCEIARRIASRHELYVCTNNRSTTRAHTVARDLGIPLIESPYRKPDPRVISGIAPKYPLLVVGDKYLTDWLFAWAVGAEYVHVVRQTSENDGLSAKIAYLLDDAVSFLVNAMKRWT